MNQTTPPIKSAIIGFGQSGELSHAYGLQANPDFEIAAVCDLSAERRAYAQKSLACQTFSDHRELIQSQVKIDLASVVTRSDTHCEIACELLQAGINVLITKPWALDTIEAERLLLAEQMSGKRIFTWAPMYWSPEYTRIKELIDQGAIGRIFTIRRYITQFSQRSDWQTELKCGGGYLNNWGSHIVQPLLGLAESPIARVSGHLQQVINGGDGDDNFLAVLQFENGILGIAEYAQAIEGLPSFLIQGTQGMIASDGSRISLLQKDPALPDDPTRSEFPIVGKRFGDEADIYRDVAHCLLTGAPFKVTTLDACYATAVLEAVRKSHQAETFIAEIPSLTSSLQSYS